MDLQLARTNMIEQQVRPWDVLDQRVLDVLSQVPREEFLAPAHRGIAYSDFQLPIGFGQHMLKPTLDGRLLQSLQLETTDSVLEIGTGSGYLTSCLARLAAQVESIEIIPELTESARIRLQSMGVGNATLRTQDAAEPWDARAGYDAIAFSGQKPLKQPPKQPRSRSGGGGVSRTAAERLLVRRKLLRLKSSPVMQESLATLTKCAGRFEKTVDCRGRTALIAALTASDVGESPGVGPPQRISDPRISIPNRDLFMRQEQWRQVQSSGSTKQKASDFFLRTMVVTMSSCISPP